MNYIGIFIAAFVFFIYAFMPKQHDLKRTNDKLDKIIELLEKR